MKVARKRLSAALGAVALLGTLHGSADARPALTADGLRHDGARAPRVAPTKPQRPVVGAGQDARRLVLKIVQGADVRLRDGRFVSPSGRYGADRLNETVGRFGASAQPAFRQSEAELARMTQSAERRGRREQADLNLYFEVTLPERGDTSGLLAALNDDPDVELAYAAPVPVPAVPTPNYEPMQDYTDTAPGGIDSDYANGLPGGDGSNVRIVDIEGGWNFAHEDLGLPASTLISGQMCSAPDWVQHGTAVLGELVAPANGFGVTGMVPGSSVRTASIFQAASCTASDFAQAVLDAATHLDTDGVPGGVILIELQYSYPGVAGWMPAEVWQAHYDAIALATSLGLVVVEAAGNSGNDLDAFTANGQPIFDRSFRDSGAIMVGAGCPPNPPADHPNCTEDRKAINEPGWWGTNYGSRVDVQGWGNSVTTAGYGDLFNQGADRLYTDEFGGTSSASPIVAAAAAAVQGRHVAIFGNPTAPSGVRDLLVETGTEQPQADAAVRPIGPRPDLREAFRTMGMFLVRDWWEELIPLDIFDPWPCLTCPPIRRLEPIWDLERPVDDVLTPVEDLIAGL